MLTVRQNRILTIQAIAKVKGLVSRLSFSRLTAVLSSVVAVTFSFNLLTIQVDADNTPTKPKYRGHKVTSKAKPNFHAEQGRLDSVPQVKPLQGGLNVTVTGEPNVGQADALLPMSGSAGASNLLLKGGPLQGGVAQSVPKTPDDVAKYLIKMRKIISDYKEVILSSLSGPNGLRADANTVSSARAQTLGLIRQIQSTVPPQELTNKHNELAAALGAWTQVVENPNQLGSGPDLLMRLAPMGMQLAATLEHYHQGVTAAIAYYKLSPELDPLAETATTVERAKNLQSEATNQFMQNANRKPSFSLQMDGDSQANNSGDLQSMLGGLGSLEGLAGMSGGSGSGADLPVPSAGMPGSSGSQGGSLESMLGGLTGGGSAGMSIGDLIKMLGALGKQGGGGSNALNSLINNLGQSGGSMPSSGHSSSSMSSGGSMSSSGTMRPSGTQMPSSAQMPNNTLPAGLSGSAGLTGSGNLPTGAAGLGNIDLNALAKQLGVAGNGQSINGSGAGGALGGQLPGLDANSIKDFTNLMQELKGPLEGQ